MEPLSQKLILPKEKKTWGTIALDLFLEALALIIVVVVFVGTIGLIIAVPVFIGSATFLWVLRLFGY